MLIFLMTIENEETRNKLERLYYTYYKDMYITAYSILKDQFEAEDVVQDAIIRLSNHLDKILEVKSKKTRGYLIVTVKNLSFQKYNKRKSMVLEADVLEFNKTVDKINYIEEEFLKSENADKMVSILAKVNKSYADILMLRYYYEMEIEEIAKMLNISENNVSVKIHRALSSLKKCIVEKEALNE